MQGALFEHVGEPTLSVTPHASPSMSDNVTSGCNGIPVLAHPAQIEGLDDVLITLKQSGLEGMEVYYAEYDTDMIRYLESAAQKHGLLPCGGTDYHANGNPGEPIPGDFGPPPEVVERLFSLAAQRGGIQH